MSYLVFLLDNAVLAKKPCRLDTRKFSFSQRTVNEWNRLSPDSVGGNGVNILRQIGWTLDKPKGFLVHLPSRVEYLGGNLVKSC